MKTLITLIIILTIIVILTLWIRIKRELHLNPKKYLYFKPNFSPSIHSDEESESDVQKLNQ